MYSTLDLNGSYSALFELMWYSQIPCFNILNVTTKANQNYGLCLPVYYIYIKYNDHGLSGMIKRCMWRGQPISCAAIFKMQPTDQGMCCSFNKEKAEEMFLEGRYQEHLIYMTAQDEIQALDDSQLPGW